MPIYKNTAGQYLHLYATDYNGDALASETLTTTILLDNGTFASTTNSAVDETGGVYSLLLTQAETNAGSITVLTSTSTSTAEVAPVIISTTSPSVVADAVWNEVLDSGTFDIADSAGKRIRSAEDKIDIIDTNVDSLGTNLGTANTNINTIDTNVDAVLVDTGTTLDTKINTLQTSVDSITTIGSGAITHTYTVTDGVNPIENVDVWVTTDIENTIVVAGTSKTDVSGEVTFYLDAGTYYFWSQKSGFSFPNPDTEVIS